MDWILCIFGWGDEKGEVKRRSVQREFEVYGEENWELG